MKDDFHVILDDNETYDKVASDMLQRNNIKNYKKYINDIYIEKFFSRLNCKEDCKEVDCKKVDVKKTNIFGEKICFFHRV